jgi:hypothetical protein
MLAEIRLALAAGRLLILADVVDRRMIQSPMMWDGSCVEVFGSPCAPPEMHQVFLSPATAQGPARAGRLCREFSPPQIRPEPAIQLATQVSALGYRMAAAVPLGLLGAADGRPFLLAFSVTGASSGEQFQRAPLFCTSETQNVNHYAQVTPSGETASSVPRLSTPPRRRRGRPMSYADAGMQDRRVRKSRHLPPHAAGHCRIVLHTARLGQIQRHHPCRGGDTAGLSASNKMNMVRNMKNN